MRASKRDAGKQASINSHYKPHVPCSYRKFKVDEKQVEAARVLISLGANPALAGVLPTSAHHMYPLLPSFLFSPPFLLTSSPPAPSILTDRWGNIPQQKMVEWGLLEVK
jgi:hypothetical protein